MTSEVTVSQNFQTVAHPSKPRWRGTLLYWLPQVMLVAIELGSLKFWPWDSYDRQVRYGVLDYAVAPFLVFIVLWFVFGPWKLTTVWLCGTVISVIAAIPYWTTSQFFVGDGLILLLEIAIVGLIVGLSICRAVFRWFVRLDFVNDPEPLFHTFQFRLHTILFLLAFVTAGFGFTVWLRMRRIGEDPLIVPLALLSLYLIVVTILIPFSQKATAWRMSTYASLAVYFVGLCKYGDSGWTGLCYVIVTLVVLLATYLSLALYIRTLGYRWHFRWQKGISSWRASHQVSWLQRTGQTVFRMCGALLLVALTYSIVVYVFLVSPMMRRTAFVALIRSAGGDVSYEHRSSPPSYTQRLLERTIPGEWAPLETLNLKTRQSLDEIIPRIPENCNLIHVKLFVPDLEDDDLRLITSWLDHTVLSIQSPKITDAGVALLTKQPLTALGLKETKITDQGLGSLPKNLRSLHLHESPITDAGLIHLKRLPHLTMLGLHNTAVTNSGLATIAQLPINRLLISGKQVTNPGLPSLANSSIEYLDLRGTSVDDDGVPTLIGFLNLRDIFFEPGQISERGEQQLLQAGFERQWIDNSNWQRRK